MLFIPSFLPLASHRNMFHSNKPFKELLCTDVKLFISVCGHTPNSRKHQRIYMNTCTFLGMHIIVCRTDMAGVS